MLKLSRRQDYAIQAVSRLGTISQEGSVSARILAESTGIPAAILANILKDLCRAGFVRSERGVRGGYSLAVDLGDLTVGRLLRSLAGPTRLVECVVLPEDPAESACACGLAPECPTKGPLRRLHERIQAVLDEVSFAQLILPEGPVAGPFSVLAEHAGSGVAGADEARRLA